jgi:hypothetical protein
LSIADVTVKPHLKNIYQKLDVGKRREAVEKAVTLGIFSLRLFQNVLVWSRSRKANILTTGIH